MHSLRIAQEQGRKGGRDLGNGIMGYGVMDVACAQIALTFCKSFVRVPGREGKREIRKKVLDRLWFSPGFRRPFVSRLFYLFPQYLIRLSLSRGKYNNSINYRAPKNGLYVVARNLFLLYLTCSAWPCLGPA